MPAREISASHFADDIRQFLECLAAQGVEFMVVGGEAVIYHGYPRVTGDVDIFYRLSDTNTKRLFDALVSFWGGRVPGVRSPSSLGHDGIIVQFGVPPHRIDLINRIDGVSFEDAWRGREKSVLVDGKDRTSISFIGLDALIRNKKAAGRPKDIDDLRYLKATRARARKRRNESRR